MIEVYTRQLREKRQGILYSSSQMSRRSEITQFQVLKLVYRLNSEEKDCDEISESLKFSTYRKIKKRVRMWNLTLLSVHISDLDSITKRGGTWLRGTNHFFLLYPCSLTKYVKQCTNTTPRFCPRGENEIQHDHSTDQRHI